MTIGQSSRLKAEQEEAERIRREEKIEEEFQMKKLIFLITLSFSSASFSQSFEERLAPTLSEKLIPKIPKTPGLICIKDQCARIGYFSHPPLWIAVVSLHGEDFIGWRPPCPYCDDLLQDHAAAEALEEQVKRRFPDAKTGDKFQQLNR